MVGDVYCTLETIGLIMYCNQLPAGRPAGYPFASVKQNQKDKCLVIVLKIRELLMILMHFFNAEEITNGMILQLYGYQM